MWSFCIFRRHNVLLKHRKYSYSRNGNRQFVQLLYQSSTSDVSGLYIVFQYHKYFYKYPNSIFHLICNPHPSHTLQCMNCFYNTFHCHSRNCFHTLVCRNGRGSNFLLHNQRMWNKTPPQERISIRPNTPSLRKQSCIRLCRPHNRLARNTRNPPFPRISHTRRSLRQPSCRCRNSSPYRSLDRSQPCRRPNSRSLHPKNSLYNLRYQDRILSLSHNLHWRICLSADSRHNRRIRNRPDICIRRIRWTL